MLGASGLHKRCSHNIVMCSVNSGRSESMIPFSSYVDIQEVFSETWKNSAVTPHLMMSVMRDCSRCDGSSSGFGPCSLWYR